MSKTSNSCNTADDSGWKYVGHVKPSKNGVALAQAQAQAQATAGKWGGSALRKSTPAAPTPKTFDDEFPTLGNSTTASTTTAPPTAKATNSSLSMAERMKRKLAEEEEERLKKEAEEAQLTLESEERLQNTQFTPIHSILARRIIQSDYNDSSHEFDDYKYDPDYVGDDGDENDCYNPPNDCYNPPNHDEDEDGWQQT